MINRFFLFSFHEWCGCYCSQKESLSRRIVEAGEEHNNVVKELSLRVKGEENLRKVCQRRLQARAGALKLVL